MRGGAVVKQRTAGLQVKSEHINLLQLRAVWPRGLHKVEKHLSLHMITHRLASLRVIHLPSHQNRVADAFSRQHVY